MALAFCGRPSLPDGGDTPAAVTEGALDEVERVGAPVRDAAESDDHFGIFGAHLFCIAPYLTQIRREILTFGQNPVCFGKDVINSGRNELGGRDSCCNRLIDPQAAPSDDSIVAISLASARRASIARRSMFAMTSIPCQAGESCERVAVGCPQSRKAIISPSAVRADPSAAN